MKTVFLAHHDQTVLDELVPRLCDLGYQVTGAARTAGAALMLASHTPADLALVGNRLAGKRCGTQLRQQLQVLWGLDCEVLDEASLSRLTAAAEPPGHGPARPQDPSHRDAP
jgi:hypothetical protein